MQKIEITRHVDAPAQRVWDLATDLERAPTTLSGVTRVEVLTGGPFAVGTRWRETRTMFGREASEVLEVTSVEEHRSYTVEAASGGARYVSTFTFTPTGAATDVTITFGAHATTPVGRVLAVVTGPLARRSVERALRADLEDLARAAEAG
nr:SRPBCC family protein [uncultured Actinotalea sp.]